MGVEWEDCDVVAELLGIKTFLNEFVAYASLSGYIKNRQLETGRTISVSTHQPTSTFSMCTGTSVVTLAKDMTLQ